MRPVPERGPHGPGIERGLAAAVSLASVVFAFQAYGLVPALVVLALTVVAAATVVHFGHRAPGPSTEEHPVPPERARFVAQLSREIRTPMNGILGMTELLLDSVLEGDQQEYAQTIHESTTSLLATVDQVLDLSRIESGDLDLAQGTFALRECIQEAVEASSSYLGARGIELDYVVDPELPGLVRGDRERLAQLLSNCLDASVELGSSSVRLEVARERRKQQGIILRFLVRKGTLPSPLSAPESKTLGRSASGHDLKLAIAAGLARALGGELAVTPEWLVLSLPFGSVAERLPADGRRDRLRGLRMLVVDDSPDQRATIRTYGEAWGMTVEEADSCQSGLTRIREASVKGEPFDVAILDEDMSGKGGREMARLASVTSWVSETRLILLMGPGRRLRPGMLLGEGFSAWMTKPFGAQKLETVLLYTLTQDAEGDPTEPPAPRRPPAASSSIDAEVLVVEDNVVNQKVACLLLESLGCRTVVACDGRAALELLEQRVPDLVLMDCLMPVMDGFEATRSIRRSPDPSLRRLPIVAMTASAMPEDRDRCLEAGMNDHLPKPVPLSGLRRILNQWVEQSEEPTSGEADMNDNDILDPEIIQSLKDLGGDDDPGLFEELVQLFMDDTPGRIRELNESLASGDHERLARAAHALKSSTANLGAMMLSELFKQIEQAGKNHDLQSAGSLVRRSEDEYARVTKALRSELS